MIRSLTIAVMILERVLEHLEVLVPAHAAIRRAMVARGIPVDSAISAVASRATRLLSMLVIVLLQCPAFVLTQALTSLLVSLAVKPLDLAKSVAASLNALMASCCAWFEVDCANA